MPKVKYDFEADTGPAQGAIRALGNQMQAAQAQLSALGQEAIGVAGGVGLLVGAVGKLRDALKELQDLEGTFQTIETSVVSLETMIGKAQKAFDAFAASRRQFDEEQSDAELAHQIRMGDVTEGTGRKLETLGAEKNIALARARANADPVGRAIAKAEIQKEFQAREIAIRNEGDEEKRALLNQETARQNQVFSAAEARRRNANAVPGLEARATSDQTAVNQTANRLKGLRSAESALGGMGPQVNRQLILDGIEKDPEFARMMAEHGITAANVMTVGGERIADAVRSARGGGPQEISQLDAQLKTQQAAASASRAAVSAATGGAVSNPAQAELFRRSENAAAAGMEHTARQRVTRGASQFQSLGEGIEHRLGIQAMSAAEAGVLGAILQKLETSLEKARESRMKILDKVGGKITDAVKAKDDMMDQLESDIEDLRLQLANRKSG